MTQRPIQMFTWLLAQCTFIGLFVKKPVTGTRFWNQTTTYSQAVYALALMRTYMQRRWFDIVALKGEAVQLLERE